MLSGISGIVNPLQWFINFVSGDKHGEGDRIITAHNALRHAPVWHAINRICGNLSIMPLRLKQETDMGFKIRRDDERDHAVFHRPCRYLSPSFFKSTMQGHALLWGNARAYMDTSSGGYEFIILQPDRTVSVMAEGKKYHITKPEGIHDRLLLFQQVNDKNVVILEDDEVIHIPGFGYDGVEGLSLLETAALSWNTGRESDKRAHSQMKFGFSGGVTLEAPPNAFRNDKEANEFYDSFVKRQSGPENAGKPLLLRNGVKMSAPAMSNRDAEFIQARRFQREEAALWFLLESILGGEKVEGYNTQEQKNLAYLTNCLMTWLIRWSEELNVKLLSTSELNRGFSFQWDTSALLKADYQSLVTSYCKLIQHRVYSPNDIRIKLGDSKREGGDIYENPMTSSGKDQQAPDPSTQKAAKARMKHLCVVEAKRLQGFGAKVGDKINDFYLHWEDTIANAMKDVGADESIAGQWCKQSKEEVVALGVEQAIGRFELRLEEFFKG